MDHVAKGRIDDFVCCPPGVGSQFSTTVNGIKT